MKAVVIHGKLDLRQEELTTPEPGEGQVRVRMAYGGICGSDLHDWHEGANGEFVVKEPLIPGHEMSGTVDLDPSGTLAEGTPVTIHPATFGTSRPGIEDKPHLWPNGAYLGSASTTPHTQGGMSEYMVLERGMLRVLPESLPLRRAALAEPLAVGLHGIGLASGVEGKSVLISGSGPIALLPNEAVGMNLAPMISGELTVHGSFRFNDEIDAAIAMLDAYPGIEDVVTHEIPAERAREAFETAKDSEISGKVLVSLWLE